MTLFGFDEHQRFDPPPNAVACLRCKGEGIVMICRDPNCMVKNECIHARYEDCPACHKQGWID